MRPAFAQRLTMSWPVPRAIGLGAMGLAGLVCLVLLGACATPRTPVVAPAAPVAVVPQAPNVPAEAPPAQPSPSLAELALQRGVGAYRSGQYATAEKELKAAVQGGLSAPAALAQAHKHLAFVYCTSGRTALCAAAFRAAKAADPAFALTKSEAGHPMWSRTYRRALGLR